MTGPLIFGLDEYQDATEQYRQHVEMTDKERQNLMLIGLAGEIGEIANMLVKQVKNKKKLTDEEVRLVVLDELSDVLWYTAQMALAYDINLSSIAQHNIDKLRERYGL